MKFCAKCGASLEDKALFCTKCGASLKDEAKEAITAEAESNIVIKESEKTERDEKKSESVSAANRGPKQPSGIIVKLLSILLSIIFCHILLTTSTVGIVRNTFDPDMVVRSITSVDIEELEDIKIENEKGREVPIAEYILDFCNDEVKEKYDLNEEKIMEVIKDTKADEFLGEIVSDYAAYFIEGEELRELDGARVVEWLRENEKTIEDVVKYEFKEKDYQELEVQLDKSDVIRSMSEREIKDEFDSSELVLVKRGFSIYIYITLIVLACAFAGLVIVINRKKIRALFTYVTVSVAVVGGVFLILSGSSYVAMSFILPSSDFAATLGIPFEIIRSLLEPFVMPILIRGVVMFGFGIIASIVYKIVSDRRRAKA